MSPLFDPELVRRISDCGIVSVLILDRVEDAVQVARSLLAGGVNAIELTFRTPAALERSRELAASGDPRAPKYRKVDGLQSVDAVRDAALAALAR